MKIGTIGLCFVVVFLAWLQDYIPAKNRQFWSKERRCEMGFTLKKDRLQRYCQDIDECLNYRGLCKGNLHCTNTVGSYICGCRSGYETVGTGCIDIDECVSVGQCPEKSLCVNTQGNYTCQCFDGYEGDFCNDIDECSMKRDNCDNNANCSNTGVDTNFAFRFQR